MVAFLNDLLILILRVEEHLGGLFSSWGSCWVLQPGQRFVVLVAEMK